MTTRKTTAPAAAAVAAVALAMVGCAGRSTATADLEGGRRSTIVAAPPGDCGNRFVQGDFDRDGASDYACMYDLGGAEAAILVIPGTASGPTEEVWWQGEAGELDARRCDPFVSADFTGDGKTDLVCLYEHHGASREILLFASTGSSFTVTSAARWTVDAFDPRRCESRFTAGDFNGDGTSDLACLSAHDGGSEIVALLSTGSAFERVGHEQDASFDPAGCASRVVAADFDGDGMSDLACVYESGEPAGTVFVFRADESRFQPETWLGSEAGAFEAARCGERVVAGDFNGDGRSDLACMYDDGVGSQHIVVLKSSGARLEPETWLRRSTPEFDPARCDGRFAVGRLDGDELDDLACMYDFGTRSGHPHGQAAESRILAFLSTGRDFGRVAAWPEPTKGPAALDVTHCAGRLVIGRTPSPHAGGASWGGVSCGTDYGPLGVGVRHHLLNPELLEFERPLRAVGDPLRAVRGPSAFVTRRLASCRAVETLVYDQPTLGYSDVEYRRARRVGKALVLVGDTPPTSPFVLWLPPDVTPTEMIDGEAHYDDGVSFAAAFEALATAHPGMIRMISFDEPYIFHRPLYHDRDAIREGYAPFKDVLVDASKSIHEHGIPVWINFSRPELELMLEDPPVPLNSPHFDVISVDWYHYGTDLLGAADVGAWFEASIEPLLEGVHHLRVPVAWNPDYLGQRQHQILVVDGFVFQPWNAEEIQNVNDLFYAYSEWAREANQGHRDPPVVLQAPYHWSEDSVYNGLGVVPRLLRYWEDFNRLPLCS